MIDFNELIERHLDKELREKEIGRYYPSEVGNCIRKSWYSYKYPRKHDKELIKIFQVGDMIHNFIVGVLKSEKNPHVELIGSEVPIKIEIDGVIISGRIDDVIEVKIDNEIYLLEVKSSRDLRYVNKAKKSHVMQLHLYMYAKNIHKGIILYVEKNTLQSKAFEISYDEKIVNEAIGRLKKLHYHLIKHILPEPEARINEEMKWQCRQCPWKDKCLVNS